MPVRTVPPSDDPDEILIALADTIPEATLRRWCCQCVRRVWDQLSIASGRKALTVAEAYLCGTATASDLRQACEDSREALHGKMDIRTKNALRAANWCVKPVVDAVSVARSVAWAAAYASSAPEGEERAAQAKLLRDCLMAD